MRELLTSPGICWLGSCPTAETLDNRMRLLGFSIPGGMMRVLFVHVEK